MRRQHGELFEIITVFASGALELGQSAAEGESTPGAQASVLPLYHHGFRSAVQMWSDAEKAVITFSSCGGCARAVTIRVRTFSMGSGIALSLASGYMKLSSDGGGRWRSGLVQPGANGQFSNYNTELIKIILDPSRVHYLNITDLGEGVAGEVDHDSGGYVEVIDEATGAVLASSCSSTVSTERGCEDRSGWARSCASSSSFHCVLRIQIDSACECTTCQSTSTQQCDLVRAVNSTWEAADCNVT
eukprot:COSAG05_NODE_5960_length_1051_cov_0.879202_1_plen_244_part_10